MAKATLLRWLLSLLALVCWILGAPPAQAHNGPPRITLGAERVAPGAAVEIQGINIAAEQPVMLSLAGGGAEYSFGAVMGDEHGDFTQIVTIPRQALAGAYVVRAFGPARLILTAPLTVVGTAQDEEARQREQEEPLLAAMPQPRPALPNPTGASASAPLAPAVPQSGQAVSWMAVVVAGLAAALIVAIAIRRRIGGASARGSRAG